MYRRQSASSLRSALESGDACVGGFPLARVSVRSLELSPDLTCAAMHWQNMYRCCVQEVPRRSRVRAQLTPSHATDNANAHPSGGVPWKRLHKDYSSPQLAGYLLAPAA